MNLKVVKRYVDKFSKNIVEVDTILADVAAERAKELIAEGVAEATDVKATKKAENKQEG